VDKVGPANPTVDPAECPTAAAFDRLILEFKPRNIAFDMHLRLVSRLRVAARYPGAGEVLA
jgi:hypothetical protein